MMSTVSARMLAVALAVLCLAGTAREVRAQSPGNLVVPPAVPPPRMIPNGSPAKLLTPNGLQQPPDVTSGGRPTPESVPPPAALPAAPPPLG